METTNLQLIAYFILIFFCLVYLISVIFVFSFNFLHPCTKFATWNQNMKFGWIFTQVKFRVDYFFFEIYLCVFIVLAFLVLRIFLSIFYWEFLNILKYCWIYSSPDDTTGYKMLSFRKISCSLLVFWLIKYYLLKQLCI